MKFNFILIFILFLQLYFVKPYTENSFLQNDNQSSTFFSSDSFDHVITKYKKLHKNKIK